MRPSALALAALLILSAITPARSEDAYQGRRASSPEKPTWEFAVTAYPTDIRGGDQYTSGIAAADRGPLHLEARYSYEAVGARSAFVGWTFSGGDTVTWELTPIIGGAWRAIHATIPGVEASVAFGRFDVYVEAEYVHDHAHHTDNYIYAWSELGFKPQEWLRIGVVGQHTRAYGGDRDVQRGPFAQVSWGPATLGAYWFNPGAHDQIVMGSIGLAF